MPNQLLAYRRTQQIMRRRRCGSTAWKKWSSQITTSTAKPSVPMMQPPRISASTRARYRLYKQLITCAFIKIGKERMQVSAAFVAIGIALSCVYVLSNYVRLTIMDITYLLSRPLVISVSNQPSILKVILICVQMSIGECLQREKNVSGKTQAHHCSAKRN
jgi:hypothetical protein